MAAVPDYIMQYTLSQRLRRKSTLGTLSTGLSDHIRSLPVHEALCCSIGKNLQLHIRHLTDCCIRACTIVNACRGRFRMPGERSGRAVRRRGGTSCEAMRSVVAQPASLRYCTYHSEKCSGQRKRQSLGWPSALDSFQLYKKNDLEVDHHHHADSSQPAAASENIAGEESAVCASAPLSFGCVMAISINPLCIQCFRRWCQRQAIRFCLPNWEHKTLT